MSAILNDAIKYIEEFKNGLLITTYENDKKYAVDIYPFANSNNNVYFLICRDKDKNEKLDKANIYFENKVRKNNIFKSVYISGKLIEVLCGTESYRVLKILAYKNISIKWHEKIDKIKKYNIYKLNVEFIRLNDYTSTIERLKEII